MESASIHFSHSAKHGRRMAQAAMTRLHTHTPAPAPAPDPVKPPAPSPEVPPTEPPNPTPQRPPLTDPEPVPPPIGEPGGIPPAPQADMLHLQ